ncbi:hypothetical protein GW835_02310 [archaeon]|nr:hypothetical protein [archaeon]NCP79380.1 hypothetical protein [archaeon]NCP97323.1 hypothetical protein [archaeon]NCQ07147.1 hypothetical protein [archaeon]NCQ50943.1 hypothetical protein [archaeon]
MNKKYMLIVLVLLTMILIKPIYANDLDVVKLSANLQNQDPDPAVPGEYLELRFNVYKTGNNSAENIQFYLDVEHPLSFDLSDTPDRNISLWKGQSGDDWYYTLYYKVLVDSLALEGDYEISLRYKYNDIDVWNIEKFNIRVDNKEVPNFVFGNLLTTPRKLLSGQEEAKIDIDLLNIGKGDAENVILEVNLPEGFNPTYAYSDRINLGNIDASQNKTGSIYLDIDDEIKSGIYQAKVKVKYIEESDSKKELKEKEMILEIPVKAKPYLKVTSQEVLNETKTIFPGQTIDIKINVKNFGDKDAESVSLRVLKDSSHPFDLVEKSDFIGNLESLQEGEAVISIEVDPNANLKEYKLNVEIRSISENTVFIDDDSIILKVVSEDKNKNNLLIPILVVLFLLAGLIYYISIKKKNKKGKK